jgi:hypothetical protein
MHRQLASNVRRVMARTGLTLRQVVEATGLCERTVKGLLAGKNKPHARTLHLLAAGLGVSTDELFQDPSLLAHQFVVPPGRLGGVRMVSPPGNRDQSATAKKQQISVAHLISCLSIGNVDQFRLHHAHPPNKKKEPITGMAAGNGLF